MSAIARLTEKQKLVRAVERLEREVGRLKGEKADLLAAIDQLKREPAPEPENDRVARIVVRGLGEALRRRLHRGKADDCDGCLAMILARELGYLETKGE